MGNFLQDVRHAVRLLAKSPGFTAVAVITLALGIGANTAIFSVVNAVLLRPLPYADDEQLVRALRSQPTPLATIASYPDYTDWRTSGVFSDAGVIAGRNFFLLTDDGPVMLRGARISATFLPTLGVRPALGRNFLPGEETEAARVAIITHGFWTQHMGRDPQAVGKEIRVNASGSGQSTSSSGGSRVTPLQQGAEALRIVGVLPENYRDPVSPITRRDLYVPMVVPADEINARNSQWLHLIARLKPGVSLQQARTVVEALSERALAASNDVRKLPKFTAVPLRELQVGETRYSLWLLLGAVGFVLLIGCANVSNLLLARANARGHEMAIRAAVGASRGRLLRQMLTESVLLSAIGGVVALMILLWGVEGVKAITPVEIPRLDEVRVDLPVFAFALASSIGCGVLFGVLPAMRSAKQDVMATLKNTRSSSGVPQRRAFATLLVGEVALTVVLLAGAALALQSFAKLMRVDAGFERGNALTVSTTYAGQWEPARQRAFYHDLVARVQAMPGVTAAGVVDNLPLSGSWSQYTTNYQSFLQKFPPEKANDQIEYEAYVASGNYMGAMGIPLRAGRWFAEEVAETAVPEIVVSESFARKIFGKESPIRQRVNVGGRDRKWAEVVGIVGDVRHHGLDEASRPAMYGPLTLRGARGATLVIRTAQNLDSLTANVRGIVRELDPNVIVQRVQSFDQIFGEHAALSRFLALLLGCFAALATLLAMIGTHGVLAYAVSQRTREIGVRLALGAEPAEMLRMVIRNGLALVAVGIGIGTAAALWLSRYLTTMLFEVSGTNPLTYVAVASSLMAAALVACYLPARRAAKTDPMVALRYE